MCLSSLFLFFFVIISHSLAAAVRIIVSRISTIFSRVDDNKDIGDH